MSLSSFSTLPTAGPKGNEDQKRLTVHYTTSQHYQENVFIEGSRPQYLEDLHTEAQEGLKILQQEGQTHDDKYENILVHTCMYLCMHGMYLCFTVNVSPLKLAYPQYLITQCSIVLSNSKHYLTYYGWGWTGWSLTVLRFCVWSCLFNSHRKQEWSQLSWRWEHCCRCPQSSVDNIISFFLHFLHTKNAT